MIGLRKILRSVRTKFIVWFLLISIIPVVISNFISYNKASEALTEKELEAAESLVLSKTQAMDNWLKERMAEIQLASKTQIFQSGDKKEIKKYLSMLNESSNVYENIALANGNGYVIADAQGDIGLNVSDETFFQNGMQGIAGYSDILISKTTGNRVFMISVPVMNQMGKTTGVLFASTNFEAFINEFLSTNGEDESLLTNEITLIDKKSAFNYRTMKK